MLISNLNLFYIFGYGSFDYGIDKLIKVWFINDIQIGFIGNVIIFSMLNIFNVKSNEKNTLAVCSLI